MLKLAKQIREEILSQDWKFTGNSQFLQDTGTPFNFLKMGSVWAFCLG